MRAAAPRYALPLLGRAAVLDRIKRLLGTSGRVVSLVGPGGVGKTRLAAAVLQDEREGIFVPLGTVSDSGDVSSAVADVLGLHGIEDADDAVLAALDEGIVVLDEAEHLPELGALLGRWVVARPDVSWLVTSRRPLDLDAEVIVEVPPLDVPESSEVRRSPSAHLLRNAAPVRLDLAADPEAVAAVLRLTAGLPLAIELAAARLALLPVRDLRARIDARYFATLRDPAHPERALQVVLDDTWAQLGDGERRSLAEASVFAGEFRVVDAEAVLSASADALDHLHTLHRWHLIRSDEGWLWLLEPVRRFVAEQVEPEVIVAARRRHAAWAAGRAHALSRALGQHPEGLDVLARLAPELRAAIGRAEVGDADVGDGISAANGLLDLLVHRGPSQRALAVAKRAIDLGEPTGEQARSALARIWMLYAQRLSSEGHSGALEAAQRAAEMVSHQEAAQQANSYIQLGSVLHMGGDLAGARRAFERALEEAGDRSAWWWGASELALVAHDQDRPDESWALLDQALARARAHGDLLGQKRVLEIAATIAVERRQLAEGRRWNTEFREVAAKVGDARKLGLAGLYDGILLEVTGDFGAAQQALEAARAQLVDAGAARLVSLADGLLGRVALERGDVQRASELLPEFRSAWTQTGAEADVYAAVVAALRGDVAGAREHATAVPGSGLAALSVGVAELLARSPRELIDAARLADLRAAASAIADPIDRRLGLDLVERAEARGIGWVLAEDGSWARSPDGEVIDLSRSRANAAMLAALVRAWRAHADSLTVHDLADAGWPGEVLVEKSARSRVYVGLSALRKAGLEDVIVRDAHGWSVAPGARVHVERTGGE